MYVTLRHPYATMQQVYPEHYADWRMVLLGGTYRTGDPNVSAAFTSLFLEQFWAHSEELHDLLQLPAVMSLHLSTLSQRSAKFSVIIQACVSLSPAFGGVLRTVSRQTPARPLPRATDLTSACDSIREDVRRYR